MAHPWEQDIDEESWSDREAWRGDLHLEDVDQWRQPSSEAPIAWPEAEKRDVAPSEPDWPEGLAGPEYWLFKRDCDQ